MKIKLLGKNLDDIRPLLSSFDMVESDNFELIIAHGGDGTLLRAAREYSFLPILPIRDSRTAPLCDDHQHNDSLQKFTSGHADVTFLPKLKVKCRDLNVRAINDIFIHNLDRSSALRYQVYIDGVMYAKEVVGDGVGLSSVHGSTAYYKSITHSIFRVGLGLSFSNSTEEVNHLVLPETAHVQIKIVRGPGLLVADNNQEHVELAEGEQLELSQSDECVKVYGLSGFMCPKCRELRHPNKSPYSGYVPINRNEC